MDMTAQRKPVVVETKRRVLSPKQAAEALFAKRASQLVTPADHAVVTLVAAGVDHAGKYGLSDGVPYRRIDTVTMSIEEWNSIPKNPRQRDEVIRIEKNRATHLLQFDPKHVEVAMAVLPNGDRYKVDGHTRTAVWRLGLAQAPDFLMVDVYACADINAAQQLYDRFDNTTAAESGTDRVTGAYRQAGISPTSPMLKSGEISTAIRQLFHYIHRTAPKKETKNAIINEGVLLFAKEIELLDSVAPTRTLFPTGVLMGAIISLAHDGKSAIPFWAKYAEGGGNKADGRMDSVQALHERRMNDKKKGNSVKDSALMASSVAAVGGFKNGATYTVKHGITAKSKDLMRKYANEAMARKGGL